MKHFEYLGLVVGFLGLASGIGYMVWYAGLPRCPVNGCSGRLRHDHDEPVSGADYFIEWKTCTRCDTDFSFRVPHKPQTLKLLRRLRSGDYAP